MRLGEQAGQFYTPGDLIANQYYVSVSSDKSFIAHTEKAADSEEIRFKAISFEELKTMCPEAAKSYMWMFQKNGANLGFIENCISDKESKYYG